MKIYELIVELRIFNYTNAPGFMDSRMRTGGYVALLGY